jgi:hypothetical protein
MRKKDLIGELMRNGGGNADGGKAMRYRDALLRIGISTTEKRVFNAVCDALGLASVEDLMAAAKRRRIYRLEG